MRNHIVGILVIFGLAASFSAHAEQTERTGKACKEHLTPAVLNAGISSALMSYDGSKYMDPAPAKTKLMNYEVQEGMPELGRKYVTAVKQAINECEAHCDGLTLNVNSKKTGLPLTFKCDQLKHAPASFLDIVTRDNAVLSDSANLKLETIFPKNPPPAEETVAENTDPEASSEIPEVHTGNIPPKSWFKPDKPAPTVDEHGIVTDIAI